MDYDRQIADGIVKLRESRKLGQVALAKMVGVVQPQISRLETAAQGFRMSTLAKIAHALGVEPVYFWLDDERPSSLQRCALKPGHRSADAYCRSVGRQMRMRREDLGISATGFAKKVGLSQAQVSRLENGHQGFRSGTLARIAKALGVAPASLFRET